MKEFELALGGNMKNKNIIFLIICLIVYPSISIAQNLKCELTIKYIILPTTQKTYTIEYGAVVAPNNLEKLAGCLDGSSISKAVNVAFENIRALECERDPTAGVILRGNFEVKDFIRVGHIWSPSGSTANLSKPATEVPVYCEDY